MRTIIGGGIAPKLGRPFNIPARKLRQIESPTLVILGGKDGLIGSAEAAARRARHNIPGCEIEILPSAGHGMSVDEPEFVGTASPAFSSGTQKLTRPLDEKRVS